METRIRKRSDTAQWVQAKETQVIKIIPGSEINICLPKYEYASLII